MCSDVLPCKTNRSITGSIQNLSMPHILVDLPMSDFGYKDIFLFYCTTNRFLCRRPRKSIQFLMHVTTPTPSKGLEHLRPPFKYNPQKTFDIRSGP